MADVTKPLFLDETGQRIANALETMAVNSATQIASSWNGLKQTARAGRMSKIYNIGDIFTEKWLDTADNNKSYDFDWRLIDRDKDYEDADGNTVKGSMLEMKWASPFGVQFSHQQAFLACPDGLPAGTYHLTLGAKWGNNAVKDKVYQFALPSAVVKGGRLAGFYGMPDQAPTNWKVYIYDSDGKNPSTAIDVTEGSAGTDLGTMALNTHTDGVKLTIGGTAYTVDMNSMQETAYGHNRWRDSALRQYLNSDRKKNLWWTAQNEFDIQPDQLASKDGFLCGVPAEMLKAIRTIKVVTYANTVQDGGGADITYDKFFPLGLEQLYIEPQITGEGEATEYYKQLNGSTTKYKLWNTYSDMIHYAVENHASAQHVRLRSAYRDYANNAFRCYASGSIDNGSAGYAYRFCPACVIG